ncbi:ATP-dependent helicase [Amaricoccus sp.]|uniref:ATP-dependent helicase n=1 Tax=Amaricoccus sp. TaxID=1872485 RepID=UPI002634EAC9|nr:ATP-dependent helicase [Amaricoccus sp.]HRO10852.1 ATP-dependent helicase [Amaricoccus sp.]
MDGQAPCPAYLDRLNDAQRAAVLHGDGGVAGPLLVVAGAGSGKTGTLAHRVAHLMVEGADPRRILLLTFSRRAAAEMLRRVERIAGEVLGERGAALAAGLGWAGTFHAIGARVLREHAPLIGLDPGFTLHDRADSEDLMGLVRHGLGLTRTESRFPGKGTCLAIYSRAVNAREGLAEVLAARFPWCAGWEAELRGLFAGYVEAKQAGNVLDYDDLLLYWAELLADPAAAAALGAGFDHVLVDEYQDTNRLQAEILAALKPDGRGVTVVGDDAQAIYGFRAAEVRNILDFPARFAPPARVVTLERNYRSTQPILAAANAVIGEAGERFAKALWSAREGAARPRLVSLLDEAAQAEYVCSEVLAAREEGVALKAQAVLFRAAHHSGPLEVELVRRNVPFVKYGGLKFLEAAHVKDLLAVLRLAENPRDRIAGFRVLQLLPGVGPSAAEAMLAAIAAGAEVRAPKRAAADWPALAALLRLLGRGRAGWPAEIEAARAWYEPHLERLHEDAAVRKGDLGQLGQIAAGFASRRAFLTELTLDPPQATGDLAGPALRDEDYLVLSTIHSAKGQEWKSVFLLNCVDGCLPSDLASDTPAEIEEERRLMYVAMTRAKDALHLLTPLRFYVHGQAARGDRHVYAPRSRFLPGHLLDRFEQVAWAPPAARERGARAVSPRDLKLKMRGMWG